MYGIIQELAPTNDTIDKCWWESKITDCWGLFKPVLTEEGVCYTYNSLNSHDIYTEQWVISNKLIMIIWFELICYSY